MRLKTHDVTEQCSVVLYFNKHSYSVDIMIVKMLMVIPVHQDVTERQGGSGGHQTCQSSGGGEGHVLCKKTSTEVFMSCLV